MRCITNINLKKFYFEYSSRCTFLKKKQLNWDYTNAALSYFFLALKEVVSDEHYDNDSEILLNNDLPIASE